MNRGERRLITGQRDEIRLVVEIIGAEGTHQPEMLSHERSAKVAERAQCLAPQGSGMRLSRAGRPAFQVGTRLGTEFTRVSDPSFGKSLDPIRAGLGAEAAEELNGIMS